jgi:hypothetical protein
MRRLVFVTLRGEPYPLSPGCTPYQITTEA